MRDCVCDPRVRGALFFKCMVARLCWHFCNFPWLCKVFSQTSLHFASQFRILEVISQLGGDFATISQPKAIFIAKEHFRSPKVISQPKAIFAAKGHFRKPFRSPFRSCEMGVWGCEMALVCQGGSSQLRKFSQMVLGGCETISQRGGDFHSGSLLLPNFAAHALSLLFELLLIPKFLLSPFLTFLLILIIQKPILH